MLEGAADQAATDKRILGTTERGGFGFLARVLLASEARLVPLSAPSWRLFLPLVGEGFGSNPPLATVKITSACDHSSRYLLPQRREGDSNPRCLVSTHAFQAWTLNHSDISPKK